MSLNFLGLGDGVEKHWGADRRDFISGSIESTEDRRLFIQAAE